MGKDKPSLSSFEALSAAMSFTEDDLNANRDSYISETQRDKLVSGRASWTGGVLFGLLSLPTLTCIYVLNGNDIRQAFILGLVGIGGLVWAIYCWIQRENFETDLRIGQVASIEGEIRLNVFGQRTTKYNLAIYGQHFEIDKPTFLAFKNGDPYIVYYAPRSQVLLSAEWLGRD